MKLKIILILVVLAAITVTAVFLFNPKLVTLAGFGNTAQENRHASGKDSVVAKSVQFERDLMEQLHKLEVNGSNIKRTVYKADSAIEIKTSIPRGKPMEWVIWKLTSELKDSSYTMDDCYYESDAKGCRIQFSCKERGNPVIIVILMRSIAYFTSTAKMAIYIEDFGFQADQKTVEYLSFSEPLTVGLLPQKKLTTWTAQIADEYKKEIVLMLPMEPVPKAFAKQYSTVLMVHYTEERIKQLLDDAMEKIPHFSGIASYYGTRVLADSRVMSIVLNETAAKKGYFLTDHMSRNTTFDIVAQKYNIPSMSINKHIDTTLSVEALQDTLRHCALIAQKTGSVIVSSKPGASFVKALTIEMPVLKQNGIKLVYLSELAKDN